MTFQNASKYDMDTGKKIDSPMMKNLKLFSNNKNRLILIN